MKAMAGVLKTLLIILILLIVGALAAAAFQIYQNGECFHIAKKLEAVEPTCTEPGLTDGEECILCGAVLKEQEEIPALGHEFGAEGCLRCGLDYSMPALSLGSGAEYSLTVGEYVGLNFRLSLTEADVAAGGYVSMRYENRTERVNLADAEVAEDGKYIFSFDVSVLEIEDDVTAQRYTSAGQAVGTAYTVSVKDYCDEVFSGSGLEAEKTMIRALLNYAGFGQIYNGTATEETSVNAGLYAAGENPVDEVTDETLTALQSGETGTGLTSMTGMELSGMMLSLDSAVRIKFVAEFAEGYDWDDYEITVSDGIEYEASGDILTLKNIAAINLDRYYTVTIRNQSDGTELTFGRSVLSVASRYLALEDEKTNDLIRSMYLYNVAAHAYFTAKGE